MGKRRLIEAILGLYEQGNALSAKDKSKITVLKRPLRNRIPAGLEFCRVSSIDESSATEFIIKENCLLPPFISIDGLGTSQAEEIVKGREKKPYTSLEDLKKRGKCGDTMIEKFKQLGIVSHLPDLDQITLF